jgi:hypothetical protein
MAIAAELKPGFQRVSEQRIRWVFSMAPAADPRRAVRLTTRR